jgi:HK97 family phage prohead protease
VFGNVDQGNDLIEPGAFTKTLQENPEVPILWAHDPDQPIGVSATMTQDGKGLRVEGQLAMEVQRARELHALMKMGAIKGLSIGYRTVKRSFKGAVRHLEELKLGEFSPSCSR